MEMRDVQQTIADMTNPMREADQRLQEVINLANSGVDWEGQALGEVASTLDNIQVKVDNLKQTFGIDQDVEQGND